jgi:hypothetical protein
MHGLWCRHDASTVVMPLVHIIAGVVAGMSAASPVLRPPDEYIRRGMLALILCQQVTMAHGAGSSACAGAISRRWHALKSKADASHSSAQRRAQLWSALAGPGYLQDCDAFYCSNIYW